MARGREGQSERRRIENATGQEKTAGLGGGQDGDGQTD